MNLESDIAEEIKKNINWLHERTQKTKSDLVAHEAVCAERYIHISQSLTALNDSIVQSNNRIQEIHETISASKVSLKTLMFVGSLVLAITGFIYTVIEIINKA